MTDSDPTRLAATQKINALAAVVNAVLATAYDHPAGIAVHAVLACVALLAVSIEQAIRIRPRQELDA